MAKHVIDMTPIFVLGPPRSGTSMMRSMLNATGRVAMLGDVPLWNFLEPVAQIYETLKGSSIQERCRRGQWNREEWERRSMEDFPGKMDFVQPAINMDVIGPMFKRMIEHACNPLEKDAIPGGITHFGMKDARGGLFHGHSVATMLTELFMAARFKIIIMIRNLEDHLESLRNVPWLMEEHRPHFYGDNWMRQARRWNIMMKQAAMMLEDFPLSCNFVQYERRHEDVPRVLGSCHLPMTDKVQELLDANTGANKSPRNDPLPDEAKEKAAKYAANNPIWKVIHEIRGR